MGAGYRRCRYARPSPYWLKPIRALATLLPPNGGQYAPLPPYFALRGSIRALATLLPPTGGNTLRCRPISPVGLNTGFFCFVLAIDGMAYESMAFGEIWGTVKKPVGLAASSPQLAP